MSSVGARQVRLACEDRRHRIGHCRAVGDGIASHFRYFCRNFRRNPALLFDLSDKPVAASRKSLDEARIVRRFPERAAQPFDGRIDAVVELDNRIVRPQFLADFLAQHRLAGVLDEHEQDLKRLIGQVDPDTVLAHLAGAHVQLEGSEVQKTRLFQVHFHR